MIVHRDIKLENFLFIKKGEEDFQVKITDFGSAFYFNNETDETGPLGTPSNYAPEVIQGSSQNYLLDYWGIGIILYMLKCKCHPF